MFDAIRTAKTVATNFIAEKGYAAYQAVAAKAGVANWRNMTEDQALQLCKAMGHGAVFANAKERDESPHFNMKSLSAVFDEMAANYWNEKAKTADDAKKAKAS